ncbi:epoxide hydrolase 3-like [Lytechinus pictus]|uniref:epoxide hydrolase 3-like n=1 Tax=Lytechinus pictus TaxID=7653 RepID=UPI00240D19AC|nr:epoxide hydrolase 3-like [Lytechinus pictus]
MANLLWNVGLKAFILIPFIIYSISKGFVLLGLSLIFRGRKWMFVKKERTGRPPCMDNPSFGTHKTVRVKGLNLHVVVSGNPQHPLMLFLHGFPECWYSWRHQIKEFNKDYYCVSFDMRGVGESDAPLGVKNYSIDELVSDVSELVKVLGYTSCVVVGHDWGGAIAWEFASRYPDLVEKLINMNIPHLERFREVMESGTSQLFMSWYIMFFQLPRLPEILISMGDYAMIKAACKKGPTTDEDIEAFKYSMSRPGRITSFLNYYRAMVRYPPKDGRDKIQCPTLLIWGTGDTALHTDNSYGTEKFCEDLTVERIEGGDHFIQQERPNEVNEIMRKYLADH